MSIKSPNTLHATLRDAIQRAERMAESGDERGGERLLVAAARRHALGIQAWADQTNAGLRDCVARLTASRDGPSRLSHH